MTDGGWNKKRGTLLPWERRMSGFMFITQITFAHLPKKNKQKNIEISVSQNHSHFFSPNRNDSRENTFLLVMGWESNIQTFHKLFSGVFFSCYSCLFLIVEKIGILEFCCTSSRELPFTFFICVLFSQSLPIGCHQSIQAREGRKTQLLFQLQGISLHSGTPARTNSEFSLKCLSFLQRKESNKKREKSKPKWLSLAARHCISRTVHERGGVRERVVKLFWRQKS